MKRRTLLRRTGALGAFVLAGCTGDGNDGTGQQTPTEPAGSDGSPTPTPTGPRVTETSIETLGSDCASGDGETARVSVDTDDRPVTISGLVRTSDPCHEAVLKSVHYDDGTDTLQVDVAARRVGNGCVQCVGAVEYEATVSLAGGGPGTVTVSHFGETVASTGEGTATPTETPTSTPGDGRGTTLVDSSLTVTNVTQTTQRETADVRFETASDTVLVTGTIEGSDGCKTAALGTVEYDPETDALAVDVVTRDREGTGEKSCTQALVYIGYEASVQFESGLPKSVTVSHDGRALLSGGHGSASAGDG